MISKGDPEGFTGWKMTNMTESGFWKDFRVLFQERVHGWRGGVGGKWGLEEYRSWRVTQPLAVAVT